MSMRYYYMLLPLQIIKRMDLAEAHRDRIAASLLNACAGHAGPEDGE